MILENINSPADVKALGADSLPALAEEIRKMILDTVSHGGGHLSSNLGAVELTLAIDRVFSPPHDNILFDVGHQCYTHKLLTGRYAAFSGLRKTGGISGFPSRGESEYDVFGSAHSSNSISAAIGMATAAKLSGSDAFTVAVIGDGAFTGGMVYEALNNCVDKDLRLVIVLNDNEMSISRNVGSIDNYFSRFRTSGRYFRFKNGFIGLVSRVPLVGKYLYKFFKSLKNWLKRLVLKENFFELLDLEYYGPLDGNDENQLEIMLRELRDHRHGISVVHVRTKKGLGYSFAENNPEAYHSVGRFDLSTGIIPNGREKTFSYNAGKALTKLATEDGTICAVTAAMTSGTGLDPFAAAHPDRFYDVGIAEEHAVTFCAGLSSGGMKPVFAVYSTFMQRCFDQLLMDVSLQGLSIVLAVDRAGFVGDDGPTHHGLFDVALLSEIPGALVMSPDCTDELEDCFRTCFAHDGVSAVRYPRGRAAEYDRGVYKDKNGIRYADFGAPECCIITYGRLAAEADRAARMMESSGIGARVIRLVKILPLDTATLAELCRGYALFAEEGSAAGGIAEAFAADSLIRRSGVKYGIAAQTGFAPYGDNADVLKSSGLSAEMLVSRLKEGLAGI